MLATREWPGQAQPNYNIINSFWILKNVLALPVGNYTHDHERNVRDT